MAKPFEDGSVALQITTRVDPVTANKLKIVCAHERRSKAKILEFALEEYIVKYFQKNPELPLAGE